MVVLARKLEKLPGVKQSVRLYGFSGKTRRLRKFLLLNLNGIPVFIRHIHPHPPVPVEGCRPVIFPDETQLRSAKAPGERGF